MVSSTTDLKSSNVIHRDTNELINYLFEVAVEMGVSDIQIRSNQFVYVETHHGMERLEEFGVVTHKEVEGIFKFFVFNRESASHGFGESSDTALSPDLVYDREVSCFTEKMVADFSAPGVPYGKGKVSGRLRVQAHLSASGLGMTCRILNDGIPSIDILGIDPDISDTMKKCVLKRAGLCLVTGPTGSGKSTTLAALVDWVRKNHNKHIVTIEDPIEYAYPVDMEDQASGEKVLAPALVTQQEVGRDIEDFSQGLKDVLRKAPHIILLGEIRDRKAMETCMEAAQTGHLVLSTLHTTGAVKTIGRILEMYPKESHSSVLNRLGETLIFIQSQGLLKGVDQRVLTYEFLHNSDDSVGAAIAHYDKGSNSLEDAIMRTGNVRWDIKLGSLLAEGKITQETFENARLSRDDLNEI